MDYNEVIAPFSKHTSPQDVASSGSRREHGAEPQLVVDAQL